MNAGRRTTRVGLGLVALAALFSLAACGGNGDGGDEAADRASDIAGRDTQPEGAAVGDHWHAAFGIQVCGDLLDPVADARPDRTGLHSHRDGLIHIHPFTRAYAGDGATLAAFFDTVGYEIDGDVLHTPKGELKTSAGCDGEEAALRLLVDGREWEGDIATFRPQDGQVLQLLFDVPGAAAVDLPWAEGVRSPADVQALPGLPGGSDPAS